MKKTVDITEQGLQELINEYYADYKQDVKELEQNIDYYKSQIEQDNDSVITDDDGDDGVTQFLSANNKIIDVIALQNFGEIYNQALKIKADSRDRLFKIISIVQNKLKAVKAEETDVLDANKIAELAIKMNEHIQKLNQ